MSVFFTIIFNLFFYQNIFTSSLNKFSLSRKTSSLHSFNFYKYLTDTHNYLHLNQLSSEQLDNVEALSSSN